MSIKANKQGRSEAAPLCLALYSKETMITRGYLIGEIVDGLSTISQQVETRCKLGLTDLNRYLEDFFKDYLNIALSKSLTNLNDQRSNEPGLDLGDENANIAFQITSTKTSAKVNKTLERVVDCDDEYEQIYVLIIGSKQSNYTLDESLCKRLEFSKENIWDVDKLCKIAISLKLDVLQTLYELIKRELTRVRIELEIPDDDGNYPTTINSYIEAIPKPQLSTFKKYLRHHKDQYEYTAKETKGYFLEFSNELSQLPRITREFYAFLLERREQDDSKTPNIHGMSECLWFNYNKLVRVCSFPNLKEELTLLDEHGFADIEEPMEHNESPFVRIFAPVKANGFIYDLTDYIDAKHIGYRKPLVALDFSEF